MLQFAASDALCTRCGACVRDCPVRIIAREDGGCPTIIEEEADDCMGCQHCLAVCPTGALSILGKDPEDSTPLNPDTIPSLDSLETLVRGRRSVRQYYKTENVDPALLQRLLAALANVPTGVNMQELTFRVIDDHEVMDRFREKAMSELRTALDKGEVPEPLTGVGRFVQAYYEEGLDIIFRGAPHLLIATAPPDAPCPVQDVALSLAYFELLAQSAGLGTVWCGLISMALAACPHLKADLGIPEGHHHYQMLFGNPSVKYARTVQRDDGAEISRIEL